VRLAPWSEEIHRDAREAGDGRRTAHNPATADSSAGGTRRPVHDLADWYRRKPACARGSSDVPAVQIPAPVRSQVFYKPSALLCDDDLMLSGHDAPGFCLAMAQIIPTLLVAVFVAERTLSIAPTAEDVERSKKREEQDRETARRNVEREEIYSKLQKYAISQRSQLIEMLKDAMDERQRLKERRKDFVNGRDRLTGLPANDPLEEEARTLLPDIEFAVEQLDRWIADADVSIEELKTMIAGQGKQVSEIYKVNKELAQESGSVTTPFNRGSLLQGWYKYTLGLEVLVGLIGESFALLGGLQWIASYRVSIFLSSLAVLLILGLMAQNAWLRLGPELTIKDIGKLGKNTDQKGMLAISIITAIASILLFFVVY